MELSHRFPDCQQVNWMKLTVMILINVLNVLTHFGSAVRVCPVWTNQGERDTKRIQIWYGCYVVGYLRRILQKKIDCLLISRKSWTINRRLNFSQIMTWTDDLIKALQSPEDAGRRSPPSSICGDLRGRPMFCSGRPMAEMRMMKIHNEKVKTFISMWT